MRFHTALNLKIMITLKNLCRTICAMCALAIVSCVDESYRVDKISTEVTVCQETTVLPIGYYETKSLGDLLGDTTLEGLEDDGQGNYSFVFEGTGEPIEFNSITREFEIPKIESSFEVDYPKFNFDMKPILIEKEEDITELSGLDAYISEGRIPSGVTLPTIKGGYQFEFGGEDLHVEFDVPEQIKSVDKVIFRDVESGHHGAPMHISVALNGLKDINAGGNLKFDLQVEGGKFRILDADNNEICDGDHYEQDYTIESGADEIDFVIYVESLTNTQPMVDHHLDIPLTLTYNMAFEIDTKAGYFNLSNKPHIELYADFEYGGADVSVEDNADLINCEVSNSSPIQINGLPEELVSVNRVAMKQDENAVLNFFAHGLGWLGDVAEDLLVEVVLPDYLAMKAIEGEEYSYDANTHTLVASVADLDKGIAIGIDALDFGTEGISSDEYGTITLDFSPKIRAHFANGSHLDVSKLVHDNFTVSVGIEESTLAIESVSGKLDYSYGVNKEFALTGVEDIDLEIKGLGLNPVFVINITHPLTVDVNLAGSIIPVIDGVDVEANTLKFESVAIPAAKFVNGAVVESKVQLILADESLREQYAGSEYTFVACDVAKLLHGSLPESLKIDLTLGVDSSSVETLYIPDNLNISYDYRVDIPLALDNSFEIRYADEIADLKSMFKAVGDLDITVGDVTIIATVTNSTPLQLAATATLKDENGETTDVQLSMEDGSKILGSSDGVTPKESVVRFNIDLGQEHSISAIGEVDAIAFELVGTSAAAEGSVGLSLDQEIGVKLQLEIAGGVTLDLKEL